MEQPVGAMMRDLIADTAIPIIVQYMDVRDIPQVMAIEKESFPLPWSTTAYRHELTQNEHSHYIVARKREPVRTPPPTPWTSSRSGRCQRTWPITTRWYRR